MTSQKLNEIDVCREAYENTGRDDFDCLCGECFSCGFKDGFKIADVTHDDVRLKKQQALMLLCEQFILRLNIGCAETIHQTDRVIENAYEFIQDICDIVGYAPDDEDSATDD